MNVFIQNVIRVISPVTPSCERPLKKTEAVSPSPGDPASPLIHGFHGAHRLAPKGTPRVSIGIPEHEKGDRLNVRSRRAPVKIFPAPGPGISRFSEGRMGNPRPCPLDGSKKAKPRRGPRAIWPVPDRKVSLDDKRTKKRAALNSVQPFYCAMTRSAVQKNARPVTRITGTRSPRPLRPR